MSEHHLSDNSADWPRDPFKLLGVDRNVDQRTLRRAYLKLIKIFKPEQSPDEFQKIRGAFEAATAMADASFVFDADSTSGREPWFQHDAPIEPDTRAEDVLKTSTQSSVRDTASAIWAELRRTGDEALAYSKLRELEAINNHDTDLCVKLYWILRLHPEVDPDRHRNDWLTRALLRNGAHHGLAWQLYLRELRRIPSEAQSSRCHDLLNSNISLELLAKLLTARWTASAQTGDRRTVATDVDQHRPQFAIDYQEEWASLLSAAIRAWSIPYYQPVSPNPIEDQRWKLMKRWSDEVTELSRRAAESVEDEIDFNLMMAREWDRLDGDIAYRLPAAWFELIAAGVSASTFGIAAVAPRLLPKLFADPLDAMQRLNNMAASVPALTITMATLILDFCDDYRIPECPLDDASRIKHISARLKASCIGVDYGLLPRAFLDICLSECISPRQLASIADAAMGIPALDDSWATTIQRDLVLQVAYSAARFVLG